jgi:hypothetical protein
VPATPPSTTAAAAAAARKRDGATMRFPFTIASRSSSADPTAAAAADADSGVTAVCADVVCLLCSGLNDDKADEVRGCDRCCCSCCQSSCVLVAAAGLVLPRVRVLMPCSVVLCCRCAVTGLPAHVRRHLHCTRAYGVRPPR